MRLTKLVDTEIFYIFVPAIFIIMATEQENKIKLLRTNTVVFQLNDLEMKALNKYCAKYRVKNRSKFIREAVITAVLERFDRDYPSLFDELNQTPND